MRNKKDDLTLDIFEVPQPLVVSPCAFRVQVSELVSEMLASVRATGSRPP